jgi:hypothetical protein
LSIEIKCAYCGRVREKQMFVIGASKDVDWVMHEGTGKMSCDDPVCWELGREEGRLAIERHTGLRERR